MRRAGLQFTRGAIMCEKDKKEKKDAEEVSLNLEKVMHERNRDNHFAKMLGIRVVEMRRGYAKAVMTLSKDVKNPIGSVHGGCLFTLADVVCGAAASSYGMQVTTLDSSFHFLRAGFDDSGELFGTAQVIKHGKRVTVLETKISDQTGRVLCAGTFTYMSIGRKLPY
jgi:acyl-CoA thioesterase